MSLITVLDENTINQIAAGEVVERPSAVVKELVENAVDAKSTAITVEIKDGGLSLIRITDNGQGLTKEDIPLAFLRHATSKIRKAEDLLSVTSLGFRGEALSSIAAVAQVELITKTSSALNGFRYTIEGGEEKSMEEIGCPGGTTIIVRNLFYNTPARRKFLKSAMTETGYVSDLMERLIVSHPDISFKFIVNNQVKLQSAGNNNTKDILYQIYGRDISRELLPVELQAEELEIKGFIGKPVINRGNRNFTNYFINGRYIKSNIITKAIEEAYKPFMMQHKYPFTSLYISIDPSQIDVNVHPQKLEIRFKNADELYRQIFQTIRDVLSGKELIPKVIITSQEEKQESLIKIPEPFEENRRRQFESKPENNRQDVFLSKENNSQGTVFSNTDHGQAAVSRTDNRPLTRPFSYDKFPGNVPLSQVGERPADYLSATKPLISSANPLSDTIFGSVSATFKPEVATPNIETEKENNEASGGIKAVRNQMPSQVNTTPENTTPINTTPINTTPVNEANDNNVFDQGRLDVKTTSHQMYLFEDEKSKDAPFLSGKALQEHRILGQIFSTYWLVEYRKELYIIDQHAAHEKVLYERIMALAKEKTHESQQLYPPIVLTLTLREQELLRKNEEVLNQIGYEFEHFGGNEYSVRAVPANLYRIPERELLLEFIDSLADEAGYGIANTTSILERCASLSCKAAIKANHSYSFEEASALIKELLTLENPYHCPHGRPVIVSMSQYELERKFKRIL